MTGLPSLKLRQAGLTRWLARLNVAATFLLLGALFILVNFVASRRYARADLTRAKLSVLSDKTVHVLTGLSVPIQVIVFYQPQLPNQPPDPLYPLIVNLLKEYERYTGQLKIEYVEPYRDRARAEQLAKQFDIDRINVIVFQSGTRHKYLSDTDLAEYDLGAMRGGGQPRLEAFKGEDAFTSVIVNVTQASSPLVWFTTGHGEKVIDSQEPLGLASLKKYLERLNVTIQPVTLADRTDVPADVKLVVIAGPTRRFADAETALLQAYLDRGGRCLALLDPLDDTGLDELLTRWGVRLGKDIVVDPTGKRLGIGSENLLILTYTQHPIVKRMRTFMTLFPLARSVRPAESLPAGLAVTALAMTSESGWGETQTSSEPFKFDEGADLKGPVPIAVAAERLPASPQNVGGAGTRLVVIGDSDFIINGQLPNGGNRDFLLGAFYWLIEQEQLIGIGPKTLEAIKLNLTGKELRGFSWFSFLAMPLACGLMGVGVWWARRR